VIHLNLIYLCSLLIDIDECVSPETNECDSNAVCNNTEGSYTCRCQNGYEGDGKSCAGNVVVVIFSNEFHWRCQTFGNRYPWLSLMFSSDFNR